MNPRAGNLRDQPELPKILASFILRSLTLADDLNA
jgi:hypothetical protein